MSDRERWIVGLFWTLDELALKSEVGIRKSEQGLKQAFFGGFSAFRLPISDFDSGFGRVYASVQSPRWLDCFFFGFCKVVLQKHLGPEDYMICVFRFFISFWILIGS